MLNPATAEPSPEAIQRQAARDYFQREWRAGLRKYRWLVWLFAGVLVLTVSFYVVGGIYFIIWQRQTAGTNSNFSGFSPPVRTALTVIGYARILLGLACWYCICAQRRPPEEAVRLAFSETILVQELWRCWLREGLILLLLPTAVLSFLQQLIGAGLLAFSAAQGLQVMNIGNAAVWFGLYALAVSAGLVVSYPIRSHYLKLLVIALCLAIQYGGWIFVRTSLWAQWSIYRNETVNGFPLSMAAIMVAASGACAAFVLLILRFGSRWAQRAYLHMLQRSG